MPLKFTDLSQFMTPFIPPGTGMYALNAAYSNSIQDAQRREMQRYHEIMAAQKDRRLDSASAKQAELAEHKKKKMALDILKAKMEQQRTEQDANEATLLEAQKLSLTDPVAAQSLLANRGLLAQPQQTQMQQPQQQQQQPQQEIPQQPTPQPQMRLPQAAIDSGISPDQIMSDIQGIRGARTPSMQTEGTGTGAPVPQRAEQPMQPQSDLTAQEFYSADQSQGMPDDIFSTMVGGKRFDFSREQEMDRRAKAVQDLFAKMVELAPEKDVGIAKQTLAMAPVAVRANSGDTQKASGMLMDFYLKSIAKKGKEKGKGGGKLTDTGGLARGADKNLYARFIKEGQSFLKDLKFPDADQSLQKLGEAYQNIQSDNGTRQWNAIRTMIKAYESGKLSDFDVQSAKGYLSLWQQWESWLTEHTGGTLSPDIRKQIADSIRVSLLELHAGIKNRIVTPIKSRIRSEKTYEGREAYKTLYDMTFSKYDWFEPLDEGEINKEETRTDRLRKIQAKHAGQ